MGMCHLKKYIFEAISSSDAGWPRYTPVLTESMFKLRDLYN